MIVRDNLFRESANGKLSLALSPEVNMKPGTNLSRFSSIFWCNRHNIVRVCLTSMLPHRKYRCNLYQWNLALDPWGKIASLNFLPSVLMAYLAGRKIPRFRLVFVSLSFVIGPENSCHLSTNQKFLIWVIIGSSWYCLSLWLLVVISLDLVSKITLLE